MSDPVPMTRESFNRLKAEVERLQNEEMPKIAEKIAEARAEGDLKENAEYHAQREAQGMLQAKINEIKSRLGRATIIDSNSVPRDQVAFGAMVTVRDLADDMEEELQFVGSGDEDYLNGKYLITSPVGQGLLGKKVGEIAEIEVPKGKLRYEVLKIEYPELDG
ncbi:MAG: transcription elongation factor GreA [Planctomycetales bacterium]|nr:transcription elongation factor GreA [Planctomycetales bacterium]